MKKIYIRKTVLFLIITTALFNIGCAKKLSDYIPDNLDIKKNIPLLQKIKKSESFSGCEKDPELCKIFKEFNPIETASGNYNYRNIKIQIYIMKFSSCDDAFGFYSALNNIPDRIWTEDSILLSFKKPYYTGLKGKYLVVFKSNPSNYFNFYKNYSIKIINSLDSSKSICKLSYHHKILPQQNRFRDSLFYTKGRQVGPFNFEDTYGAYYQTGRMKSVIYIDNLHDEKYAASRFNLYLQQIKKNGFNINKYSGNTGGTGITYWFIDDKKYTMIHRYRWFNIIIKDISKLSYGQNFLRIMYRNMIKVRKEVEFSNK